MKTKRIIQTTLIILLFSVTHFNAQEKNENEETDTSLFNSFDKMHKTAKLKKKGLPCNVEKLVEDYKLVFGQWSIRSTMNYVQTRIDQINGLESLVDKGDFSTKFDKMFEMFENSMSYSDFIKDIANRSVSELSKEEDEILKDAYYLFGAMYDGAQITFHDEDPQGIGFCMDLTEYRLKIKKKNLGQVTWEIKTKVQIDCDCDEKSKKYNLDNLTFEYTAEVTGLFTAKKKTFGKAINPTLKIISYQCCPEKEEPTKTSLNEDDSIKDLMPDQTIGFGAGVGFSQDFDETTFCVTGEYLYQINSNEDKGLYAGAEVSHQNTSFGDIKSNKTMGGGKIQYNFSGTPSGETQFVVGLMANYAIGSNDFNGFNDDFSGTIFCGYGGTNIRVSENWSIGLQFPILIFENYTFKPEIGDEFNTKATSLFVNKDNPLKIIIRRRL